MKDKIKQRKILIVVLAVILTLSVGYAIFSESLNISGSASTGSTNFNIVFDRVGSIREVEASNTTADIKENGKKLEINVPGLSMPTAYAVIPVTIKNKGEITAKVKEIKVEGLDTTDIKVTYEGLAKEDIFNPNDEKEVNIKVVWDRSSTSTSVEASFSIEIVYEQVASGSVTTTSAQTITDSRFIYEGTKLMGLSAEGEEYFKQPQNKELIIPEGTTEIADGAFLIPYGYEGEIPDYELMYILTEKCYNSENACSEEEESLVQEESNKMSPIQEYNKTNNRFKDATVTIPNSVKKIGKAAFAAINLTGDLTIPNSVEMVDYMAFAANSFNGNLKLSNNLKVISNQSFGGNQFVGDLVVPDRVERIEYAAFMSNTFNGNLSLGNSLLDVGAYAFGDNKFIGDLNFPDSLISIGRYSFAVSGFNGNLTFSNNLKNIKEGAFSANQFIGDLVIPNSVVELGGSSFESSGFTGTLTLPNGITSIGKRVFYDTGFIGELYIPDTVTDIDYNAFWDCNNLTSVSIPTNTTYKEVASGSENPSFPSGVPINKR